ncbi:hypothetical protein F4678DRAFT_485496 [Xylaria arbuscula]|nr:hypothetical protein F4678DRAFT_485496 [Xylaria arbuscula]
MAVVYSSSAKHIESYSTLQSQAHKSPTSFSPKLRTVPAGKTVFVLVRYPKQMEAFFAHNPGIPSRIPIHLEFQDYEDNELLRIMHHELGGRFSGRMKIEGALGGFTGESPPVASVTAVTAKVSVMHARFIMSFLLYYDDKQT